MPFVILFILLYIFGFGLAVHTDTVNRENTIIKIDSLSEEQLRMFTKQCVKNHMGCEL
jgi:hypothetical protein